MNQHLQGILLPLSARQQEVLGFMWAFYRVNDMLPSHVEICRHFNWTSSNAAQEIRYALRDKGYIELNAAHKYRFSALFHAEQRSKQECQERE